MPNQSTLQDRTHDQSMTDMMLNQDESLDFQAKSGIDDLKYEGFNRFSSLD